MEELVKKYSDIADRYELLAEEFLKKMPEPSWAVVLLFYSGLHRINSVLVICNFNPEAGNHRIRNRLINDCNTGLEDISREYRELQNLSEQIRYFGKMFSKANIHQFRDEYFSPVKQKTQEILGNANFPTQEQLTNVSVLIQKYQGIE